MTLNIISKMLKPKEQNNKIVITSLFGTTFLLGMVAGKFINFPYVHISKEINLVDIISVCVTIFAAYIVSKVLDKEKQDYRTEKDLIIRRTEDIYNLIDDSHSKVISGSISYPEASSHFKRINVSLTCIFRILDKTQICPSEELKKDIFGNIKHLRNLLTDTPIISDNQIAESNLPSEVKNSIIHLTQNRILEIESEYDKLRDNILHFQLSINKA